MRGSWPKIMQKHAKVPPCGKSSQVQSDHELFPNHETGLHFAICVTVQAFYVFWTPSVVYKIREPAIRLLQTLECNSIDTHEDAWCLSSCRYIHMPKRPKPYSTATPQILLFCSSNNCNVTSVARRCRTELTIVFSWCLWGILDFWF
jgi:hypothetical protein